MKFDVTLEGLDDLLKTLDPQVIVKAGRRAVQRAAQAGRTVISSQVRERFAIKKADIDRKIGLDLSRINDLTATLTVRGQPISLTYFGPSQVRGNIRTFASKNRGLAQSRLKRSGGQGAVSVKIIKGKTAKLNAFIAAGKSGNVQVFRRRGAARLPIDAIKVVGYASMVNQPKNIDAIKKRINEQLEKEMHSALDYYMGKGR